VRDKAYGSEIFEMNPVRAFFLSMIMLSGIALWGAGIYTADASAHMQVVDGYGVSASR
jgi:hypothetical membrane protein